MTTWADCLAYLEAHCNPEPPPLSAPTVLYAQVLWVLAECLAVQSVLEVGIGPTSVSGCTFAHSMASRGGGSLTSIDVDTSRPKPAYRAWAQQHGVSWSTYYGDSLSVTLPTALTVDLLYIDGDHDVVHAYGDTLRYLPYLRVGGYLVIDDFPAYPGVLEAGQELNRQGFQFVHLAHHPPHGNGRLLWQKPR
jgi:predicted O-methyltransferase YrrM